MMAEKEAKFYADFVPGADSNITRMIEPPTPVTSCHVLLIVFEALQRWQKCLFSQGTLTEGEGAEQLTSLYRLV